ncbi:DMT family transporter [Atopomonas sediminilitoris]|uniref:DMT family transporter n=1 Tax=Atopomonas sediminilitoris TaxID=2919919 RepID=UPI001F4E6E92|nr:DMT family transporter [Atopomonas sediminilitoris]MCJ8169139.1 DMT family transporter [Atopomonas sediminilitoris]
MHVSSGRWLLGLGLALTTAVLWGLLPIKLKPVLASMDPITVTWFRLISAGLVLLAWLAARQRLPDFRKLKGRYWLLVVAIVGLVLNYVAYLMGLKRLSAGTTQLVIQLAPIFLLLGSVLIYREGFSRGQQIGLLVLLTGFTLFFNQRWLELMTSLTQYTVGILIMVFAALTWAFYGLAQKQLLTQWGSVQIMMVIYLGCASLLTPWAKPALIFDLNAVQLWLLLACCLNTLVAYGAFAEALAHWQASRVSATLAITPLITFACAALGAMIWPQWIVAEPLNALAYLGALLVALGSAQTALDLRARLAVWRSNQKARREAAQLNR